VDRANVGDPAEPSSPGEAVASVPTTQSLRQRMTGDSGSVEMLLFSVGSESFAVPLEAVREALDSVDFLALPDMPSQVRGAFSFEGSPLLLYNPNQFLGVASTVGTPSVLVIGGRDAAAGLVVDTLIGSARIELHLVKKVPALEDDAGAFAGVFFFGEQLVTLVDPATFLRQRVQLSAGGGTDAGATAMPREQL
jgi:purine-binding chemotaxis protein CheW